MKFKLDKKALQETINVVGRAVAAKTTRPILMNLLVTANDGHLRFVGSDSEIMMISTITAEVEQDGYFTIPAKLFQEIIGSIPDNEENLISIELNDEEKHEISVFCGRNRYYLQIQDAEDYPPVPVIAEEEISPFVIDSQILKQGLKEAGVAMNTEDGNPVQKSVCVDFAAGAPTLVSTDGRRLAVTALNDLQVPEELKKTFIVPSRAVSELIKLLDENKTINISMYNQQLVLSTERFMLITRLVDGKFPDYNRVLPKESSRSLKLERKEFQQALKAVMPIARSSSEVVYFEVGQNETRIWAQAKEMGTAEVFLNSELTGEPINIAFNAVFVLDFINNISDKYVVIDMTTPNYPGLLKSGNPESEFKYVLMPMSY